MAATIGLESFTSNLVCGVGIPDPGAPVSTFAKDSLERGRALALRAVKIASDVEQALRPVSFVVTSEALPADKEAPTPMPPLYYELSCIHDRLSAALDRIELAIQGANL